MSKRAYTFAKATASQMDEQSILTDSQKNGGLNIDVKDLAKASDVDPINARLTAIENFLNGKNFLLADDQ